MAISNLSWNDFASLRCSKCNLYLSHAPITLDLQRNDGFTCGRCVPSANQRHFRIAIYETLAKNVKFPCIFHSSGCLEEVHFGDVQNHEGTCGFRTIPCPVEDCKKFDTLQNLQRHFVENHAGLSLTSSKFRIPQKEDCIGFDVFNVNGLVLLLQFRSRSNAESGRMFDVALSYFIRVPNADHRSYCVRITSTKNSKSITTDKHLIGRYQPGWIYPKQELISMDFHKMQNVLGSLNFTLEVFVQITESWKRNLSGSTEKQAMNKLHQVSEPTSGYSNETVEKSAGPSKNFSSAGAVQARDSFLDDLDCDVCQEYMNPPIFVCTTGHSICSVCRKNLTSCPTCKAKYRGARNFKLEKLSERMNFLCIQSATIMAQESDDVPEKSCFPEVLDEVECPLVTITDHCTWKGSKDEVHGHAKSGHPGHTEMQFNRTAYLDFVTGPDSYRFVVEFDNKPFILDIVRQFGDSYVMFGVKHIGLSLTEKSTYKFVLDLCCSSSCTEAIKREIFLDSYQTISRQILAELLGLDSRLFFRINAVKTTSQ